MAGDDVTATARHRETEEDSKVQRVKFGLIYDFEIG